jgi:hypothetical protein
MLEHCVPPPPQPIQSPAPSDNDDDSFDYGEFDYKEESLWEATEEEEEQWEDGSELADPE